MVVQSVLVFDINTQPNVNLHSDSCEAGWLSLVWKYMNYFLITQNFQN